METFSHAVLIGLGLYISYYVEKIWRKLNQ